MNIRYYLPVILLFPLILFIISKTEETFSNVIEPSPITSRSVTPTAPTPESYVFVTKWGSQGVGNGQFREGELTYFVVTDKIIEKFKNKLSEKTLNKLSNAKNKEMDFYEFTEIFDGSSEYNDYNEYYNIKDEAGIYKPIPSDGPLDIEVDKEGYVYIPDHYNNRIQKFDSNGKFITKWGSEGKNDGQFKSPNSIKIDSSGNIYVVDYYNAIQKFDSNGKFITRWGSDNITLCSDGYIYTKEHKNVVKQLELPHSDFFINGYSYTKQYYYIKKIDSNGKFVSKWFELNINDNLFSPKYLLCNMEADSYGNIYIFLDGFFSVIPEKNLDKVSPWLSISYLVQSEEDLSSEILKKIKPLMFEKHPADELISKLKNMDLNEEELEIIMKYVEPYAGPGLVVFDSSGSVIKELNITWPILDVHGSNLTIDLSGNLYVAYRDEHCIKKFDSNGNLITTLGSEGNGDGQFKWPEAVAVDSSGYLYVMDTGNFRVQKFAPGAK